MFLSPIMLWVLFILTSLTQMSFGLEGCVMRRGINVGCWIVSCLFSFSSHIWKNEADDVVGVRDGLLNILANMYSGCLKSYASHCWTDTKRTNERTNERTNDQLLGLTSFLNVAIRFAARLDCSEAVVIASDSRHSFLTPEPLRSTREALVWAKSHRQSSCHCISFGANRRGHC